MNIATAARAFFVAGIFALLSLLATATQAQTPPTVAWPPAPAVKIAVNPVTNKVYTVNEGSNTVTVTDLANNTMRTIPVGQRPFYIAVNPTTNRIYVNNATDASVTVIDGATDTVLTTLHMGSIGPIQFNPTTNTVYVVRLSGPAWDEVTYVNGNTDTYYSIATQSFQPIAMAVNPVNDRIYIAHYATGDVRVISGAYSGNDHPSTVSIGVWSRPFAIAANPVTDRVYVITEDSRGPIGVINGATNTATFLPVASGHAVGPKAIAVNTVTNKVYAAFQDEIIVIDGATNALTYIPIGSTNGGAIEIGINHTTNKIYVATENGTLWTIDGATNATSSVSIPSGAIGLGVNPITNEVFTFNGALTLIDGAASAAMPNPLVTTITPAGGAGTADPSFTLTAATGFVPNSMPIQRVYYQLDTTEGAWTALSGSGPHLINFSGLAAGSHTLFAFTTDGQDAPMYSSSASAPLVGTMSALTFTVGAAPPAKTTPSVSLSSSKNPSTSGESVTFTASVSGSSGTPTGTVEFRNGSGALAGCSAVALSGGTAACTISSLAAGSHSITANYSGDTAYNAASSGAITQTVNAPKSSVTVTLSSSPNPSEQGQSVAIVARLGAGSTAATGTVAFSAGGSVISGCSAVAVSGNTATCNTTTLAVGTHSLAANYSGDANYNSATGSSSHVVNEKAAPTPVTPTVSISSSRNPSLSGDAVTFTSTVTGSAGTPTGTVEFRNGSTAIAGCSAVALSGGTASCTTSSLAVGSHSISARYSGSSAYNAATSSTLTQTVNAKKTSITVTLSSSPNPSEQGQSVAIVARLGAGSTAATGTVAFSAGGSVIAGCSAVAVSGNSATCNTSALAIGTHSLAANYSGDANYNSATGNSSHVVKEKAPTTPAYSSVGISSSKNPSNSGDSVTFTATVGGSAGTPTGTVEFRSGSSVIAGCSAVALSGGTATCTTSSLAAGTHSINVRYGGSSAYYPSNNSLTQTVNSTKTSITVTLSSSPNPSEQGQSVAIVARLGAGSTAATGTVEFRAGGSVISGCSAVTVAGNMATCNTTALAVGTHTLTANYSGNAAYNAASGTTSQVVKEKAAINGADLIYPRDGATLDGKKQLFLWELVKGAKYRLQIGTASGRSDLYDDTTFLPGAVVKKLPTDGRKLYVKLTTTVNGQSVTKEYVLNADSKNVAEMKSPKPLSRLDSKETFKWEEVKGARYMLWVGTTLGGKEIGAFGGSGTSNTSQEVKNLPSNGRLVFVRLFTVKDGTMRYRDYAYGAEVSRWKDDD